VAAGFGRAEDLEPFHISPWLTKTLAELKLARPNFNYLDPEDPKHEDRINYFTRQLVKNRFNRQQAVKARLWLLQGNWQYKRRDDKLQLSDFYPNYEDIKELLESTDHITISRTAYRYAIEEAERKGYAMGQEDSRRYYEKGGLQAKKEAISSYYQKKNTELSERIKALEIINERYRKRIGILNAVPPEWIQHIAYGDEETFLKMVEWLNSEFLLILVNKKRRDRWIQMMADDARLAGIQQQEAA
jgi:hypothetical protein